MNDLQALQRKRLECLADDASDLSADVITMLQSTIRNAMRAGQCHARVQLLRLGLQFTYATASSDSAYEQRTVTYALHDAWTLRPVRAPTRTRVHLAGGAPRALIAWLQTEGLQFLFTSVAVREAAPADFVYVEAVFVPAELHNGQAQTAWNQKYTVKCLDDSMVAQWNERCVSAVRAGLTHFVVCTLHWPADFNDAESASFQQRVPQVRHYLSMEPLEYAWYMHKRFSLLVAWVHQLGYQWALCTRSQNAAWAYFCVLLEPLVTYHSMIDVPETQ